MGIFEFLIPLALMGVGLGVGFILGLFSFLGNRPGRKRLETELADIRRQLTKLQDDMAALNERVADLMLMMDDLPRMLAPQARSELRPPSEEKKPSRTFEE